MIDPRTWLAAVLVFAGLVLQVTVLTRLPFPGGVAPDLVILVVVALAVRTGPLRGCVTGFCAGLAIDIIPPAYHTIGRSALVYCAVGYLVGLLYDEVGDSTLLSSVAVAVGALGATFLDTTLGALLGDPRVTWAVLARVMPFSALYDVMMSPLVWYAVARLVDRVAPDRGDRIDRRVRVDRTGWRRLHGG